MALRVLGYGKGTCLTLENGSVTPARASVGGAVELSFELINSGVRTERVLVDFRIHFMKANGKASPKVFKLKALEIEPGVRVWLGKRVSLAAMTTRKHYPGIQRIEVLLNGEAQTLGSFEIV
jgi:hypothetical protein